MFARKPTFRFITGNKSALPTELKKLSFSDRPSKEIPPASEAPLSDRPREDDATPAIREPATGDEGGESVSLDESGVEELESVDGNEGELEKAATREVDVDEFERRQREIEEEIDRLEEEERQQRQRYREEQEKQRREEQRERERVREEKNRDRREFLEREFEKETQRREDRARELEAEIARILEEQDRLYQERDRLRTQYVQVPVQPPPAPGYGRRINQRSGAVTQTRQGGQFPVQPPPAHDYGRRINQRSGAVRQTRQEDLAPIGPEGVFTNSGPSVFMEQEQELEQIARTRGIEERPEEDLLEASPEENVLTRRVEPRLNDYVGRELGRRQERPPSPFQRRVRARQGLFSRSYLEDIPRLRGAQFEEGQEPRQEAPFQRRRRFPGFRDPEPRQQQPARRRRGRPAVFQEPAPDNQNMEVENVPEPEPENQNMEVENVPEPEPEEPMPRPPRRANRPPRRAEVRAAPPRLENIANRPEDLRRLSRLELQEELDKEEANERARVISALNRHERVPGVKILRNNKIAFTPGTTRFASRRHRQLMELNKDRNGRQRSRRTF